MKHSYFADENQIEKWVSAAENIKDEYGLKKALGYIIGEKFYNLSRTYKYNQERMMRIEKERKRPGYSPKRIVSGGKFNIDLDKEYEKAEKEVIALKEILTERKEHVGVLNIYLKSVCEVITITGDDSKSLRKIKMKQIESGNFQVLITTGQLLGEGLDIENLSSIFLVYPFSFEGKLIQYIGRILRSKGRKAIYDYRDKNIEFLLKLYKKRERYYRRSKLL